MCKEIIKKDLFLSICPLPEVLYPCLVGNGFVMYIFVRISISKPSDNRKPTWFSTVIVLNNVNLIFKDILKKFNFYFFTYLMHIYVEAHLFFSPYFCVFILPTIQTGWVTFLNKKLFQYYRPPNNDFSQRYNYVNFIIRSTLY